MMSRPVAGVRSRTVLVTLPGSPKGARENLQAIMKMLPHACVLAAGMSSRYLHAGGVKKLEREAGIAVDAALSSAESARPPYSHAEHTHIHTHGHGQSHGHANGQRRGAHGLVRHALPADAPVMSSGPLSNDPTLGPSRRNRASPYPMLSVDEALARIDQFTPGHAEATRSVNEDLVGHVLAEDVQAAEDMPAFRASIVDGYAVVVPESAEEDGFRKEEGNKRNGDTFSGVFPVVAVSHAAPDESASRMLKTGEIARITTGAPLPAGSNAVVMVESTVVARRTSDGAEEMEVEIRAADVRPGDNVREVGSDVRKGQVVLRRGDKITAVGGEVGLLMAAGVTHVTVCRRPVVGVLSTGSELIDHLALQQRRQDMGDQGELRLGEVRDTNRPTLMLALNEWGFDAVDLGIVTDQPQALELALRDALRTVDMVITTGGVSMGELDLLKPTIERALGGSIHFGRVAMKPGKPTTFATLTVKEATAVSTQHGNSVVGAGASTTTATSRRVVRAIFALPGNPASALVTFHLFVLPALHKMAGEHPRGLPRVPVELAHDFPLDRERPEFHRAVVSVGADGVLRATSTGGQRSSKVGSMHAANALLCMPAGPLPLKKDAKVDALMMDCLRSEFLR